MATYGGVCFCDSVAIEVTGEPFAMGYCHCASCRSWSASPVNAFTLWKPGSFAVTRGADLIGTYNKTPMSFRKFCTVCGGHLMAAHPPIEAVDIYAATLPTLAFVPQVHVNYGETVLRIADGLPKFKDFPAEFGGSGEMIAE
jgi:hypothetical protein